MSHAVCDPDSSGDNSIKFSVVGLEIRVKEENLESL